MNDDLDTLVGYISPLNVIEGVVGVGKGSGGGGKYLNVFINEGVYNNALIGITNAEIIYVSEV